MPESVLSAIAYLKAEVSDDDSGPVLALNEDDAPVLRELGEGLLVAYLVDEGDCFSYVQGRQLRAAGIDSGELHERAVANLDALADGRVTIHENGPTWALLFDGQFEASLLLLDDLWDSALCEYHAGDPAVVVPARDVLCFCSAASQAGLAELRRVVERVWPHGDHLISDKVFGRRAGRWTVLA